jgi:hypothetical protein
MKHLTLWILVEVVVLQKRWICLKIFVGLCTRFVEGRGI